MNTCWRKDPDAVLDYQVDWSAWLIPGDVIQSSQWLVPAGSLTVDVDTHTASTATVWLRGGDAGEDYQITNRVTTAAGRTDDRTMRLQVRDR